MLSINVSSLAWAALAALFVARYGRSVGVTVERLLVVIEARFAMPSAAQPSDDPIPDDLVAIVNQIGTGNAEMDGVMREQALGVLYEQYGVLGDWDKVRAWSATHFAPDTRPHGWGHS
jgi:hypothetical protein